MRLKVLVKRHNLPDTAIIWAIESVEGCAVSQLLEQVNEIIPLESEGDWGLEDYAVEVRGSNHVYECLHFQPIQSILHEDDEIIIRPLLSHDLKQRRISGRYQITSDGRHLFDGFVFGRPKLTAPRDRPAVTIPPRKRRRITYDEEEEHEDLGGDMLAVEADSHIENDAEGNRQLVIRADFEDENWEDEDDDEDDKDFEPDEEEIDDENYSDDEEEEGDEEDNEMGEKLNEKVLREIGFLTEHEDGFEGSVDQLFDTNEPGTKLRKEVNALSEAFQTVPEAVCRQVLDSCDGDIGASWDLLVTTFNATKSRESVMESVGQCQIKSPQKVGSRRRSDEPQHLAIITGSANLDEQSAMTEGLSNNYDASLVNYYDQHGLPEGTIIRGEGLNVMAKITEKSSMKNRQQMEPGHLTTIKTKSVRFTEDEIGSAIFNDVEDEEDEDDEDFASESDSSDDSSSSEDLDESSDLSDGSISSSSSDIDDDSSLSSSEFDSGPEEVSSRSMDDDLATKSQESHSFFAQASGPSPSIAPGQGKKSTKARNERRRLSNALQRFKAKGILPAGTTIQELKKLDMKSVTSLDKAKEALAQLRTMDDVQNDAAQSRSRESRDEEFEAKREELLAAIASGGVDIAASSANSREEQTSPNPEILQEDGMPSQVQTHSSEQKSDPAPLSSETPTSQPSPEISSTPRRIKLDLGAGRRLLFGALGIKTPKTKSDEDQVRKDLMKQVKPLEKLPAQPENAAVAVDEDAEEEQPDAWREKIILRAVECCHDGVELSEPPFPFVQRWDVQQQGGWSNKSRRGGKSKRRQRNETQYYHDESQPSSKKRRMSYVEVEPSEAFEGEVDEQLERDVKAASNAALGVADEEDDLPTPPNDFSILKSLEPMQAQRGMIIAFQQLVLSESTNWQPTISSYRTAVVVSSTNDGVLGVSLAKRDRDLTEKLYDEETGERVYGKFDMPDDDNYDAEDDGYRTLNFSELINPKIVQHSSNEVLNATSPDGEKIGKVNGSTDESTTLAHDEVGSMTSERETIEILQDGSTAEEVAKGKDVSSLPDAQRAEVYTPATPMSAGNSRAQDALSIMKEAGFRSSLPSSLVKLQLPPQLDSAADVIVKRSENDLESNAVGSPQFNGFDTSPLPDVTIDRASSQPQGNIFSDHALGHNNIHFDTPTVRYPKLSVPSSITSQVTDHGHQPDFPTPGEDTLQHFEDYDSYLNGDDPGTAAEEQSLPKMWSSIDESLTRNVDLDGNSSYIDIVSSDPNLPTLVEVLSQAGSMIVPKQELTIHQPLSDISEADREYRDAMDVLDAKMDAFEDVDPLPVLGSGDENESQSRMTGGSQQMIDLTQISSDNEPVIRRSYNIDEADSSYDDSFGLPRGPGWVEKNRKTRGRRKTTSQVSSQVESQATVSQGGRSSRRKTVARF